eukprot:TRINITY_DN4220_c0_g1_i1.p1 TRINITY_DN4220_c0_g1~~TRINITY_DN4220_c0_g1_i1.p1  ORF type:complete len:373 (+),score=42.96 TRINITY_DN4220_c0_g1_i1:74-1120(+)
MASFANELQRAADAIRGADALLVCTGAGMGVDSGLGTFRGRNAGVWPPLRAMQMDFSEMSCPQWFDTDPRLAWAFWNFRHQAYTNGTPHAGYGLLAQWGHATRHGLFSVTSNIDGHWIRTEGVGEERTFECHGAVTHVQLVEHGELERPWPTNDAQIASLDVPLWDLIPGEAVEVCDTPGHWTAGVVEENGSIRVDHTTVKAYAVRRPGGEDFFRVREGCPLPCDQAGRALRPNVVMFGDGGINCDRIDEQEDRFERWLSTLPTDTKIAIVEIGAGTAISTIRFIGEQVAAKFPNVTFIRLNLEDSDVSRVDCRNRVGVPLGALDALTRIDALIKVGSDGVAEGSSVE